MKLTTAMLVLGMTAGSALAQNPDIIQNTRDTMHAVQVKKALDSNAALAASQHPSGPVAAHFTPAPAPHVAVAAPASKPAAKPKHLSAVQVSAVKPATKATPKNAMPKNATPKQKTTAATKVVKPKAEVAVQNARTGDAKDAKKDEPKAINLTGRRDPFISPVVAHSMNGSGCSTGKRCLAIDQIALKGVVRSDTGMIAVVVNAVNKAYFLRENDPVFNGYVVKITGDSIIFKETLQDKLGKPFEREITKKINTPAV
jgi:Tfp pilus assembly protein PilP